MPYKNEDNRKEHDKRYYENNRERILKQKKIYYQENKKYYKEYRKEYYIKNREEILNHNKRWYENNSEYNSKRMKIWHKENKERDLKIQRKWYEKNREKESERKKRYYKTERGKAAHQRAITKQRTRMKNNVNTLTADEWSDILKKYNNKCAYCGVKFDKDIPLTRDHVIPISKGGHNTKENIVPACRSCNSKKYNNILKRNIGDGES